MAELSLGASPAMDAMAPAVIIGAIPDSRMETFAAMLSQLKAAQISMAMIGAMMSLMPRATPKGFNSSFGRKSSELVEHHQVRQRIITQICRNHRNTHKRAVC